jgi:hypothetical protein
LKANALAGQKLPNNRLHTDLAGFGPRIWIIGIPKVVLIPKNDLVPPPSR